ncbi:MAG: PASTA domain-containing protein, partial [Ilumatobacter sp.]
VEPGTVVNLVVSTGPAPRSIPEVVGQTVAAARTAIEALGLTLTESGQEFSDEVPLGSIIAQSLPVGTEVARGADLTVLASKGPDLVRFPDITDLTFDEAVIRLAEAGFNGRLTFGDGQGTVRSYSVDGREPAIGETFRRGTQVDIRAL